MEQTAEEPNKSTVRILKTYFATYTTIASVFQIDVFASCNVFSPPPPPARSWDAY